MAIDPTPFYQEIPAKLNGPDRAVSRFAPMPFYKIKVGTTGAYLVKGLVPREGLIVIWGPPKCGKSFWTFDLVMHVVLGWSYLAAASYKARPSTSLVKAATALPPGSRHIDKLICGAMKWAWTRSYR